MPSMSIASLLITIIHFPDTTIVQRTAELLYNMTQLNQIRIGAVNGVARGEGNEFLVSLDARSAVKSHSRFGQPDIGIGVVPGGRESQYLPQVIGRGRAMKYLLRGKDILTEEAEGSGWINKAFDNSSTMDAYIDEILSLLVLYPTSALGLIKQSVNVASRPQLSDTVGDANRFLQAASQHDTQMTIGKVLELTENQSAGDVELYLGESIPLLYG